MSTDQISNRLNHPVTRLTALWALNESGLGGLMFALKIPLTGFFVGGFAVILITLIAHYSNNDYKKIIRATILVLIIKATVSPHSPPPAYLAVAFQGFAGALLYRFLPRFRIAALVLAVLAMAESALQKIIVLTLIYGKSVWEAIDKLSESIIREFALPADISFSQWLIGIYTGIYIIWGFLIGLFAAGLPEKISKHTAETLERYNLLRKDIAGFSFPALPPRRKKRKLLAFGLVLLFIIAAFVLSGRFTEYKLLFIVIRSIAAVLLLFLVVRPLANLLIQRWLKSRDSAVKEDAAGIMAMLPGLRLFIKPAWEMARNQQQQRGKLRSFILFMIILTLHEQ